MEHNFRLTPELLLRVIEGEQNAIAGYERLKTMTSDREHIETLDKIIRDEHKHLRKFEEMYRRRFGTAPASPRVSEAPANTFMDGVRHSVGEELDTYELYRDIWMDNSGEQVRMPFFEGMTDENEHATRLSLMFSRELEKRLM